jgi:hypothetical protein
MSHRTRPIGQIFVNLGRLTPDDVTRALAHQEAHGGLFGEALVSLGLLTPDELRWGLADQYGLPFVQLHPDQIDRALARLVPARWAREHMVLPVLRDGDTVTVVVADPASARHFDQVQRYTGAAQVEAAVCPADHLLELMAVVFSVEQTGEAPFRAWLESALRAGSARLGVSARAGAVYAWAERGGLVERTRLQTGWLDVLHGSVVPFCEPAKDGAGDWAAIIHTDDGVWRVGCHALRGGRDSIEWVAHVEHRVEPDPRLAQVDERLRASVRAAGGGLIRVEAGPGVGEEALGLALPLLPQQLLGPGTRTFHLAPAGALALPGVFSRPTAGAEGLHSALDALRPFVPDAISAELSVTDGADLEALARRAPLVVYHAPDAGASSGTRARLLLQGSTLLWTAD